MSARPPGSGNTAGSSTCTVVAAAPVLQVVISLALAGCLALALRLGSLDGTLGCCSDAGALDHTLAVSSQVHIATSLGAAEGMIAPITLVVEVMRPPRRDRDVIERIAGGLPGISSSGSRGGVPQKPLRRSWMLIKLKV